MQASCKASDSARAPADPSRRARAAAATTHATASSLPEPLISSRARAWSGIAVELHRFDDLDAVIEPVDHLVAVQLAGNVAVHRTRAGRMRSGAMQAGDVTITPSGPPVHWRQTGQSAVIILRLSPECVRTVADTECGIAQGEVEIREQFATRDDRIEMLARHLLGAIQLDGTVGALRADVLKSELAAHLVVAYGGNEATTPLPSSTPLPSRTPLPPHRLRRALEFIDDHLDSEVTLAAIAAAIALSPGHFAHAFRQAMGVAPHRYVLERRVDVAKSLLLGSDLSLSEIAARVGCCSQSHFSVMFHRVTGVCPREFRSRG
jgi:AraC family transcriptional regulator